MSLDELIAYLGRHVVFNEEKYPELLDASDEKKFAFAIRHSALHYSKVAGKVALVAEDVDHGGAVNTEELKVQVWKSIVNALSLAGKIGMTEKEITDAIRKKYVEA